MNRLRLGMTGATNRYVPWSAENDEALARLYPTATWAELREALPGRSCAAVIHRAVRLSVRRIKRDATAEAKKKWRDRGLRGIRTGTGNKIVVIDMTDGKHCTTCGRWQPLSKFARHATCAGGRRNECTPCGVTRSREWDRAHPDRAVAKTRRWQMANQDKVRAMKLKWNVENPEKVKEHSRRTRKKNADKIRISKAATQRVRNGLLRNGPVTAAQLSVRQSEFYGLCGYCLAPATTFDHMDALAIGGAHEVSNMIPACRPCNMSKGAKTMLNFLIHKHRLNQAEV